MALQNAEWQVSDRSAEDLLAVLAAAAGISPQDLQTAISAAADARQERKALRSSARISASGRRSLLSMR